MRQEDNMANYDEKKVQDTISKKETELIDKISTTVSDGISADLVSKLAPVEQTITNLSAVLESFSFQTESVGNSLGQLKQSIETISSSDFAGQVNEVQESLRKSNESVDSMQSIIGNITQQQTEQIELIDTVVGQLKAALAELKNGSDALSQTYQQIVEQAMKINENAESFDKNAAKAAESAKVINGKLDEIQAKEPIQQLTDLADGAKQNHEIIRSIQEQLQNKQNNRSLYAIIIGIGTIIIILQIVSFFV